MLLVVGAVFWWWLGSHENVRDTTVSDAAVPTTVATPPSRSTSTAASSTASLPTPRPSSSLAVPAGTYTVAWVLDGDTVAVDNAAGQRIGTVRLLGMDAPELAHNGVPAECWSVQSSEALRKLLLGKDVRLVDDSRAKRDRFGRRLGYLEVAGQDVTTLMVRAGHAREFHLASTGPNDRTPTYLQAQRAAQAAKAGLWAACPG